MRRINSPELSRNYGFWNEEEQQLLLDSKVAMAGVGGDGFQLGLKLAQMGVQRFSVADPEVFELENNNRVPGATTKNYGHNKAEIFKESVLDINPEAKVEVFSDGVTQENVVDFMYGSNLVIDETELTTPHIGAIIARQARCQQIANLMVMNIGFAAQVTSFNPNSKKTFEKFMGLNPELSIDEMANHSVDFKRVLPFLPSYGDINSLAAISEGASLPSIAPGVDLASSIGSTQAFLHLTKEASNNRRRPIFFPKITYVDAYELSVKTTSHARYRHYLSLGKMVTKNMLNINSRASYSSDERNLRSN